MRVYIATNFIGSFAFDGSGKPVGHELFEKEPEAIAAALERAKTSIIRQEELLMERLKKSGYKEFYFSKDAPMKESGAAKDVENKGKRFLQESFRGLALELKWVSSQQELNEMINKVNLAQTRTKLRETRKDRILMNAITTLDELDRALNVFSEKLREWYGLYNPEAERSVQSHEKLAERIAKEPSGEKSQSGMEFSGGDMEALRGFSMTLTGMYNSKREITKYVEGLAAEVMPNMSAIAGPLLASRLVALAGGLEKVSRMPSSTIQLLGAEKALFRHLKGGGKAPKFGILFGHPHIQNAPREQKGKIARLIAAKLSLASRVDYFTKEDRGEKMRKELDGEVKAVMGRKHD